MSNRGARIGLSIALLLVWLVGAGIGGPYFGKIDEVSDNNQATYLPASADATKVNDLYPEFVGDEVVPAIVVFTSDDTLDEATLGTLTAEVTELAELAGVDGVSPLIPSEDGLAAEAFVSIASSAEIGEVVDEIRTTLAADTPDGITQHVTGPAGFAADLLEAFSGIDGILLAVALGAVLIILLVVYRSLLLPLIVLSTSMFALCVALLTNWWLAKADILILTGQTQGILFILVIGAATDYSLLYTARYSEELRRHENKWDATKASLRGSVEPILASGGTVIAGLLCLLLSDLISNQSLGPVAAIGIAFAMLAALTFLPAALYLLGRAAYWPRRPKFDPNRDNEAQVHSGPYAKVGAWVAKRPRPVWIVVTILLAVGAAFVPTLKADGVPSSEFVLGTLTPVTARMPWQSTSPAAPATRPMSLPRKRTCRKSRTCCWPKRASIRLAFSLPTPLLVAPP